MRFDQFEPDSETLRSLLPEHVQKDAKLDNSYVFGAFEGDELLAMSVFVRPVEASDSIRLSYVAVTPECTQPAAGRELTAFCEKFFVDMGIKTISCYCAEKDPEKLQRNTVFLEGRGYSKREKPVRTLVYNLDDVYKTTFSKKLPALEPLTKNVKCVNELKKGEKYVFSDKIEKIMPGFSFDNLDLVFARFFEPDEEIIGFIDSKEVEPKVVKITSYFVAPTPNAKFAIPAMIASTLKVTMAFLPRESTLELEITTDNVYRGIKTIFGEAKQEDESILFEKRLA